MVESSTCCSAVELEGIAALIDGVLRRENIAVDAVLSSLMSRDTQTDEHCIRAQDLVKYPNFTHLTPERLLEAPCQTEKRNQAFYPALREPRRTLIFRCVSEEDRPKILALLQKCPILGQEPPVLSDRPAGQEISQSSPETDDAQQPDIPISAKLVQLPDDQKGNASPASTTDGDEPHDPTAPPAAAAAASPPSSQGAAEVVCEAQQEEAPSNVLGIKFESSAFAPACYVTLTTEELAKEVALWLVAQELEPGRPVRVGIKSEAEWAFATPPPPITLQRRRPMNYNRNKRRFGPRRVPNAARGQALPIPAPQIQQPPAPSTSVLSALDQFPPLDASLGDQMTIRYSPKELRVIRDAVLRNKSTAEVLHVG